MYVISLKNNFVTIADTVGCSTPDEYGSLIRKIKERKYGFKLSVHCHNDLGLATANSLSGILNGAEQIECTLLGIGERAGNTALDEIIYILRNKHGFEFISSMNKL